jgi:hypothetical protein
MICALTLQIREHEHFNDFNFIILFVGILSLNAINLDAVSLFTNSSFLFLAVLNLYLYLIYSVDYRNE